MRNLNIGRRVISGKAGRHQVPILMSIVLLITISLTAIPTAQAQVVCMNKCQQQLNECLNSPEGTNCLDTYDTCIEACVGRFVDLLG
ncbi:MAG TPA: hypothetical protein VI306_25650 [Pyrinomonadaceae bacterium]